MRAWFEMLDLAAVDNDNRESHHSLVFKERCVCVYKVSEAAPLSDLVVLTSRSADEMYSDNLFSIKTTRIQARPCREERTHTHQDDGGGYKSQAWKNNHKLTRM